MFSVLVVCFGVIFHRSEAAFKTVPQNEIALLGSEVEFQCSTDSSESLIWTVTYASKTTSEIVFVRGKLTSFGELWYRIDMNISGQYNLIIDYVSIFHAGEYKCSELMAKADLAVIDTEPFYFTLGSTAMEETELVMEFKFQFVGEANPVAKWLRNASAVAPPAMVHTFIYSHLYYLAIVSKLIQQVNYRDDGTEFILKTTFTQRNNPREIVVNRNLKVAVLYEPKNLTIKPRSLTYNIGDCLVCSADGNPPPIYEWSQIGNETGTIRTIDGPALVIDETMISDKQLQFQCTAKNYVKGEMRNISESVAFFVTEKAVDKPQHVTPITEKILRLKSLQARRSTQNTSDAYYQPLEATIGEYHLSQQDQRTVHTVESTQAEIMDRSSTVDQQETRVQFHIYDNTSVHSYYHNY